MHTVYGVVMHEDTSSWLNTVIFHWNWDVDV